MSGRGARQRRIEKRRLERKGPIKVFKNLGCGLTLSYGSREEASKCFGIAPSAINRYCQTGVKGFSLQLIPELDWKVAAPVACPTHGEPANESANLAKFILTPVFIVILFLTYVIFFA